MKNYLLIGSHGDSFTDRSHLSGLVYGAYNLVVKHTIEEAEKFINEFKDIEHYVLFNMNILKPKEVHDSDLLKSLAREGKAFLSYSHWNEFTPSFVPVKEN